jgi:hypothetical protein
MQQVNTTMPAMGNLLHTATDELREQVEDLGDVLQELRAALGVRAPEGSRFNDPGTGRGGRASGR